MGLFSSLVNVSFTAGVAIVLGGLLLGGVTIGGNFISYLLLEILINL